MPYEGVRVLTADEGSRDRGLPLGSASSFRISRVRGTVVVTVHGKIDFEDWTRLDDLLRDLIDAQGNLDVVLELSEVRGLDPEAVPLIRAAAQQAHSHGGRLRLADRACRAVAGSVAV